MKKKLFALTAALVMMFTLLTPVTVFAWNDGDNGDTGNQQTINGAETGDVEVLGQIGKFDPTNPGPNPPAEEDPAWINVTVPVKMIFGSNETVPGKAIIGPKYTVKNNSARSVDVSIKSFTHQAGKATLPNDANLKLFVSDPNNVADTPAAVNEHELIDISGNLINTSTPVFIARLTHGTADGNDTEGPNKINTNLGSMKLKLGGSMGAGYDYGTMVNPAYTLQFQFKAVDIANG